MSNVDKTQKHKDLLLKTESVYAACSEVVNTKRQEADWWLPEAGRRRKCGVTINGYQVFFWGEENVLELGSRDSCTTL